MTEPAVMTEDEIWDHIEAISKELDDEGLIEELVRVMPAAKLGRYLRKIARDNQIELGPDDEDDEDDDEESPEGDDDDEDDVRSVTG
jgi:hypothetical protein